MSSTAVILVGGVLRKIVGGQVIPEGARLYTALKSVGSVILQSNDVRSKSNLADWMDLEGLPLPDAFHFSSDYHADDVEAQLNYLRAVRRYPIDLVVGSDPDDIAALLLAGFNTLLFTHASYAHPSWRPDSDLSAAPWDTLVEQVEATNRARASDRRFKEEEDE